MNKEQFSWWFWGWMEIQKPETINAAQLQEIRNHLKLAAAENIPFICNVKAGDTKYCAQLSLAPHLGLGEKKCGIVLDCSDGGATTPIHNPLDVKLSLPEEKYNLSGVRPNVKIYSKFGELSGVGDWIAKENEGKVFITISKEPNFSPTVSYSNYLAQDFPQLHEKGQGLLNILECKGWSPEKVSIVVDNSLNPTWTRYNDCRGGGNRLTMVHNDWMGIHNVGTAEPLIC